MCVIQYGFSMGSDKERYEKVTEVIQAFKVSERMHLEIKRLAKTNHRKITDQARELIDLGLLYLKQKEQGAFVERKEVDQIVELKIEEKLMRYGLTATDAKDGPSPKLTGKKKEGRAS